MRFFASFLFVTLLVPSVAAAASFDPPKRKSGLWEVKISIGDARGGPTIQECVDEKTDDLMTSDMPGGEKLSCSKNEIRKEGDRIVIDSVCKVNGSTAKARTVFTGRFDSAYKADVKSTYDPPMEGVTRSLNCSRRQMVGPLQTRTETG
jgi:hypothetical protein